MKKSVNFKEQLKILRGQGGKPGIGNNPEDAFFTLQPYAGQYISELIEEYRAEENPGVRFYLLDRSG